MNKAHRVISRGSIIKARARLALNTTRLGPLHLQSAFASVAKRLHFSSSYVYRLNVPQKPKKSPRKARKAQEAESKFLFKKLARSEKKNRPREIRKNGAKFFYFRKKYRICKKPFHQIYLLAQNLFVVGKFGLSPSDSFFHDVN